MTSFLLFLKYCFVHLFATSYDKIKEDYYMLRNSSHLIARSVGGDLVLSYLLMSLMAKTYPITKPCSDTSKHQKSYRLGVTVFYSQQLTAMLIQRSQSSLSSPPWHC